MKKPASSIASPDELDRHLQNTSFATWAVLGAVLVLLTGVFVWTGVARLPIRAEGTATLNAGQAKLSVTLPTNESLAVGQKVYILGQEGHIDSINEDIVMASGFTLDNGEYSCVIVVREIPPIAFLWGK